MWYNAFLSMFWNASIFPVPSRGNYLEKCPVRIWKRDIPLLIDLLISNNFSSMTFFCASHILRVIGRQSIWQTRQSTDFFYWFFGIIIKKKGNYGIKTPVRIWKRYIPLLIDLFISNNFSFMTFFCATRILRANIQTVYFPASPLAANSPHPWF